MPYHLEAIFRMQTTPYNIYNVLGSQHERQTRQGSRRQQHYPYTVKYIRERCLNLPKSSVKYSTA